MKNNNKKLSILVVVLLLGVGISFAYFLGKTIFGGEGAKLKGTAATLEGAKLDIAGDLKFNDLSIYPGHKTVSSITVTATGEDVVIPFNIIWSGKNSLTTELKYTVYKVETKLTEDKEIKATCEKKTKVVSGKQQLSEECSISNIGELGSPVGSGTIPHNEENQNITIATDQFITATSPATVYYYYVILEYPNESRDQNLDLHGEFSGTISAEVSDATADINILSINVDVDGDGNYEEQDNIPERNEKLFLSGKSTCTNNAILSWDNTNWNLVVNQLTKTGTECSLYFTSKPSDATLGNLGIKGDAIKESKATFSDVACGSCTDSTSGLFKGTDVDGDTYYYRGNVSNNWVKFGKTIKGDDIYWRIIRINGDGSIRLIYSGTGSAATSSTGTQISSKSFNTNYDDNKYVGYMYDPSGSNTSTSSDYPPKTNSSSTRSTILEDIVAWYDGTGNYTETGFDAKTYGDYLDGNAGFCGDRSLAENAHGTSYPASGNRGYGTNYTVYGPGDRAWVVGSNTWASSISPTFRCKNNIDLYTTSDASRGNKALPVPVGLITMDEVIFAGGYPGKNNSGTSAYYLYTGQYYWTMSPFIAIFTTVFYVTTGGSLSYGVVDGSDGVRPVINLKSTTKFKIEKGNEDKGTSSNPYIVE